jgi:hypothetical protein
MRTSLLAISAAYVMVAVLLLSMGFSSRFKWWVKATAIVVTSFFFVEVFFATKSLLGWPGTGQLPARFQLLWTRVVEPDPKISDPGAIFLWVEAVDENNVPSGVPRAYRLRYTKPLADRSMKARDEIMSGNPQEGTAEDLNGDEQQQGEIKQAQDQSNMENAQNGVAANLDLEMLQNQQHVEFRPMSGPVMPPKN